MIILRYAVDCPDGKRGGAMHHSVGMWTIEELARCLPDYSENESISASVLAGVTETYSYE